MNTDAQQDILFDVQDAVAIITVNRAKTMNTLDLPLATALHAVLEKAQNDTAIRAVALLAAGRHFMVGGDIRQFHAGLGDPPHERQRMLSALIDAAHAAVRCISDMPKPVVAGVQGAVAGYGMSLMNACDLALAADDAYFSLAYSQIGATPDGGSTYTLPRLTGKKRAAEIAMLSQKMDASRALELGLINRVVPTATLAAETIALASALAKGATAALGKTKALLNQSFSCTLEQQLLAEQEAFLAAAISNDFSEGVRAFINKRPAQFTGG